jgi:hypothetical protein
VISVEDIFQLRERDIVYNKDARNGKWCSLQYPGHEKKNVKGRVTSGCPNQDECLKNAIDFKTAFINSASEITWFAVKEDFNLTAHINKMHWKHLDWSDRQCRCVLYWQNTVRKRLLNKTKEFVDLICADYALEIPEACGINVFATMANVGLILQTTRNITTVHKIMLVGLYTAKLKYTCGTIPDDWASIYCTTCSNQQHNILCQLRLKMIRNLDARVAKIINKK